MPNKTVVWIVAFILISVVVSFTVYYLSPAFANPEINETWLIIFNAYNHMDSASATWVHKMYECQYADVNDPQEWNEQGQHILIVGGNDPIQLQAPWLGMEYRLQIMQPDTYPACYWTQDTTGAIYLHTPQGNKYHIMPENNVGLIAKGYDYDLERWIVVVIGFDGWGTAYGVKLICTQWDKIVVENSYVIFKCTQHGGNYPAQWTFDDFDGIILEYSG